MQQVKIPPSNQPAGQPGWLVTFADLLSLLLCFFVMLFASLVLDSQKFDEIKGSLKQAFQTTAQLAEPKELEESAAEEITLAPADNLDYIRSILRTRLQNDPLLTDARLVRNTKNNTLNIIMPSQLLFAPGSAALTPGGLDAVQHMADLLANLDNGVEVAGHTDASAINTPEFASNWELSVARAQTVANILRAAGVNGSLTATGYADGRLNEVDPSLPAAARAELARRVELVIHGTR